MSNDKLKQQQGPQQGNIHEDANEGKNESGHKGSTLEEIADDEQTRDTNRNVEKKENRGQTMDSEQDTMGNP